MQDTRHTTSKLGKRSQARPQSTHLDVLVLSTLRCFALARTALTRVRSSRLGLTCGFVCWLGAWPQVKRAASTWSWLALPAGVVLSY